MLKCILFAFYYIAFVASLRLDDADEGDCRGTHFQPVPSGGPNFGKELTKFIHNPAGSRYSIYLYASGHPRFRKMSERDLIENMCLTHNSTDATGQGAYFGFGGYVLGTYSYSRRSHQHNVVDYFYTPNGNATGLTIEPSPSTITLTDYKSFAFFADCYKINNSTHKSWEVMSVTPSLSASTIREIQNHAASLGFNGGNFLFLNGAKC